MKERQRGRKAERQIKRKKQRKKEGKKEGWIELGEKVRKEKTRLKDR